MATDRSCGHPPPPGPLLSPSGRAETWDGLNVYIAGEKSSAAIILVTDVFGYEVPQVRVLADYFAANGFIAVIPDILHGDPLQSFEDFPKWMPKHNPVAEGPNVKAVAEAVARKFGSVKFGVMGFCWGGKVAVTAERVAAPLISALVLAHPSRVTVEELQAVEAPVCILAAEIDKVTPLSLVKEFEATLKKSSNASVIVGSEGGDGVGQVAEKSVVKVFGGRAHGFTVRYETEDEAAVKAAKESHADALAFFRSTLLP
eukprot:TRINITY_DN4590_c0_g1_i1.p1 TRINITY_DN4590_c0_g1~~TRINITY_DN4590_c0_g1_i1.p1  ORF type:complete len:258 (+),score=75.00 TRINITY_DN4590_c0_g1_i1:148-921(+)